MQLTLVMAYGSLKRGFHNHGILASNDARFVSEVQTKDSCYELLSVAGTFPAATSGRLKVAGELYEVTETCLKELDYLEGNGWLYTREPVLVEDTHGVCSLVWMYLMPRERIDVAMLYKHPDYVDNVVQVKDGVASWVIAER